jgi:16S rRNA (cytosine1402-N4)-methyltransferase
MALYIHRPVFEKTILEYLDVHANQILLDCTCGEGGHGEIFLTKYGNDFQYIGLDRDSQILDVAKSRLLPYSNKTIFIHTSYAESIEALKPYHISQVDRILVDLGISMFQIMNPQRGFSFNSDEPLDMRFDQVKKGISAYDIVNSYDEEEISDIIYRYGEEYAARKIAHYIVKERARKRIVSCSDLAYLVGKAKKKQGKINPATQTFQALRIYVNSEFHEIESLCKIIPDLLVRGGKVAFITYHSLEDRFIKQFMRESETIKPINKKVIIPEQDEIESNPASRSAKLRVGYRI